MLAVSQHYSSCLHFQSFLATLVHKGKLTEIDTENPVRQWGSLFGDVCMEHFSDVSKPSDNDTNCYTLGVFRIHEQLLLLPELAGAL